MKTFCFALIVACALQGTNAIPRPDFGISGSVTGKSKVVTANTLLNTNFDAVDAKTITLTSGYTLLTDLKDQYDTIASNIVTKGTAVSTAIGTLSNAVSGFPAGFTALATAIGTLKTYIETGITTETDAITTALDATTYIADLFSDANSALDSSLSNLLTQLNNLKAGVQSAISAAGGATTANINKYVTAKLVTDVQTAVAKVKASIPVLTYLITNSLTNLELADDFVIELTQEASDVLDSIESDFASFHSDVDTLAENIQDDISSTDSDISGLLASYPTAEDLLASSAYDTTLGPQMDELFAYQPFATSNNANIQGLFDDYITEVDTYDDDLATFYGETACPAIQAVIFVLIEGGPYNEFCFFKYSPHVFTLFISHSYALNECYQKELTRISYLRQAIDLLLDLIVFDFEDAADNVNACLALTSPDDCITDITGYYDELGEEMDEKNDYLYDIIDNELYASESRLHACIEVSKYGLEQEVADLTDDIINCDPIV